VKPYYSGGVIDGDFHMLGILKIRDIQMVHCYCRHDTRLSDATEIIKKYLKDTPNPATRDIHRCQEELIEAGLSEFAQL